MSKFILSKAMGNIPDDMLMEAMEVKRATGRRWIIRAAACAAVLALLIGTMFFWPSEIRTEDGKIISAPGILKAYACELENVDVAQRADYALIEGDDFSRISVWHPAFGYTPAARGIALSFLLEEDALLAHEITLEISTNLGELIGCKNDGYPDLGKKTTVKNGETVHWTGYEILRAHDSSNETLAQALERLGGAYIDIIIKADGNIVGYAVVEIGALPKVDVLCSKLKNSVYFPKVNGEFQAITDKYVRQQIAALKNDLEEEETQ